MSNRRFWIQTDKTTGQYTFVVDLDEVVAINVPDVRNPGCIITLKSGEKVEFPNWDGEPRDKHIKVFLDAICTTLRDRLGSMERLFFTPKR